MTMAMEYCLLPDEKRVEVSSTTPISNGNGELTLSSIAVFEEDFRNNVVASGAIDPITAAVQKYGSEEFYDNLSTINNKLKNSFFVLQVPNYPLLNTRLEKGPITPFEFAQYIKEYGISPAIANSTSGSDAPRFLKSLEDFYTDSFASSVMGGFCSLMPNIFGAIGGFFDLIGKIDGLIGDALSFLSKIKNIKDPIQALFDAIKVKALIEAIKEKVTKAVMGAVNKIKDAITNFDIGNAVSQVKSFVQNKVGARLQEMKESISKFFSEENLKTIENKIKGMIDYAVSLFENPSLQEIQYLIARICGFASGIESIVSGLKAPLDSAADRYVNVTKIVKAKSGQTTAAAVSAGARRFDDATREKEINRSREILEAKGNPAPIAAEEFSDLPAWSDIKDDGHDVIRVNGRFDGELDEDGWNKMKPEFRVKIMRLHKAAVDAGILSGPFVVYSGWRSQQYSASIDTFESTAIDDIHALGKAADVGWDDFDGSDETINAFINVARSVGFTGFGKFNLFMHIDTASNSIWDERE